MDALRGVIRGTTIQLDQEPGLPDGQEVAVIVRPVTRPKGRVPGDGIRRSAGSWADDDPEGLDEYLEWNRRQRKIGRAEPGA
ncbi:MAG: hypothetical protein ABSG86_06810 [Thermoguttaceae bacterium]|jgi:hypothetical protein